MNGFERKTRTEIVDDMKSKAKNLFSNDVNLNVNSPLGILIQLFSYPLSLLWFALEKVYNSSYIHSATGQDLDNLAKNIGISRIKSSKAVGTILFEGDNMVGIPEGTQIETDEDKPVIFETTERVVIESGSAEAEIIALEGGLQGNLSANTLTELVNPISGVDNVTNPNPTQGGRDRETDSELRKRYIDSLDRPGGSTINSIRANILQNTNATACLILQNVTMEIDSDGLPPKSYESIVLGGSDNEIASAIFEKSPAGIESHGDYSIEITDDSGEDQLIKFSRAEQVDVYCSIELEKSSNYPTDGDLQIKDEIINYIGGIDSNGDSIRGLSINEDVIASKIISLAYNVEGVKDVLSVQLGLDSNNLSNDNISINSRQVARSEISFIEVV